LVKPGLDKGDVQAMFSRRCKAGINAPGLCPGTFILLDLEHFNIENVEMLWRRVPPPAPQA
jgi:hypothetical protein